MKILHSGSRTKIDDKNGIKPLNDFPFSPLLVPCACNMYVPVCGDFFRCTPRGPGLGTSYSIVEKNKK